MILVLGVLAIVGVTFYDGRRSERRQAEQEAANIALGVERDLGRALETFDLSIRAAREGMKLPGIADMAAAVRDSILFDGAIAAEGFGGVVITDNTGKILYGSAGPVVRPFSLDGRDYFVAARDDPDIGLALSRPFKNMAKQEWTLGLARRFNDADGQFGGVVAGGLRLGYVQDMFDMLKLGHLDTLNLFNMNGQLLARLPYSGQEIGRDMSRADVFQHVGHSTSGIFVATAAFDHVQRLYAYRQVRNLPLVITVGLATQTIYQDWEAKTAVIGGALSVLLLLGVALVHALRGELRRRALAETAARDSEREHATALAKLDVLFRGSSDAMFVSRATADGSFVYESVNPVWEQLTGISASVAVGQGPLAYIPPGTAAIILAGWQECLREGRPASYHYGLDFPDGRQEWETVVAPVDLGEGRVFHLVGVARNVTARFRLEAELRQLHRMEAVEQLTTGIAHDFNNMCQAILASMETLHDEPGLSENGRACVTIAETAAHRGAMLTHRLLAFSRKQTLDPAPLRPKDVIATLASELTGALSARIRVDCQVAEDVWSVRADAAQLDNCLYNLALNARDAMPGGGVLHLHAENQGMVAKRPDRLPPGDYVRFEVRDQGIGMPPETLARALEPFFTTKAIGEGTGLGLSMVEGFARQSGGEVEIESVVGAGTTVSIWLPRALETVAPMVVAKPASPQTGSQTRVLLVDDEPTVRQALSLMLKRAGLAVVAVDAGEAALDVLHDGEGYDLLVTDQSMPGMTGCELIAATAARYPDMPAMLITGYDLVSGLDQLEAHVTVMRKPFERTAFLDAVKSLVRAGT